MQLWARMNQPVALVLITAHWECCCCIVEDGKFLKVHSWGIPVVLLSFIFLICHEDLLITHQLRTTMLERWRDVAKMHKISLAIHHLNWSVLVFLV